ncbi:hypothetical protein FO519_001020 [Halicephalobus sp. NKZ332]|nr:hypothetical protein FO519_001020 [Halicephalobus sp. NKZ332]
MSPNPIHPSISDLEIVTAEEKTPSTRTDVGQPVQKSDARIKIRTLSLLGALLPGLGCYFCIAYTYIFQYERVASFQSSHCPSVTSPFPPVSYSIGVWKPQVYIWLLVLCFHLPPRLFFIVIYIHQYKLGHSESQKEKWFRNLIWIHTRTMFVEAFGLLTVSIIDIKSHFLIHAACYAVWLISFNFNMLFNTILHHYSGYRDLHNNHDITFQIKRLMLITGIPVSLSSGISYIIYAYLCNNIAYALFSVAECIIVGLNSGFYFLVIWEMGSGRVELIVSNIRNFGTEA